MGFFSWKTSDTKRSIPNAHASKETFPVFLKDNKGGVWEEKSYDGYGVFGGKDYHELLDEMNGGTGDRQRGIDLQYPPKIYPKEKENDKCNILNDDGTYRESTIKEYNEIANKFWKEMPAPVKFPILVEDPTIEWSLKLKPKDCEYQGYFY